MDNEEKDTGLSITEREDRLRLIIQHSLAETIRMEMANMVPASQCKLVHDSLTKLREERGKEIARIEADVKSIDDRFKTLYLFVISTLLSSLGALVMAGINYFTRIKGGV